MKKPDKRLSLRLGAAALSVALLGTGAALAAGGQKIRKLSRLRAQRADPVGGGQGGHGHQDSRFSHIGIPFLVNFG